MPKISRKDQLHQGQEHDPCSLCKQEKFSYTHTRDLRREQKDSLLQFCTESDVEYICKPCVDDIKRNLGKCNYVPRWVKVTSTNTPKCAVPACQNKSRIVQCLLTTKETIIKTLKLPPSSNESEQIHLCIEHYKVIHRSLPENKEQYDHSKHRCTACRKSIHEFRHCPNPDIINNHLKKHTDFEGHLDDKSIICRMCYNCHHMILKGMEEESTNAELVHLLEEITNEMDTLTITGLDTV